MVSYYALSLQIFALLKAISLGKLSKLTSSCILLQLISPFSTLYLQSIKFSLITKSPNLLKALNKFFWCYNRLRNLLLKTKAATCGKL